jgi:hypothetical protein
MLSPETLEIYRSMPPAERLKLTFQLMEGLDKALLSGTPEQVNRKFELIRRENDLRNQNMLTAIARTKSSDPSSE